jgi:hypothetical protein
MHILLRKNKNAHIIEKNKTIQSINYEDILANGIGNG